MRLIFLGAPGAGKGTQAQAVCERLVIPGVSTGNLLREAVAALSPGGVKAKEYMESGRLVPDDIVIGILKERIARPDCENGFILDGFPRNIAQARTLEDMGVVIDSVINLHVSDETILERMGGRRVCPGCGASFHTKYKQPKNDNICDACSSNLVVREDDKPQTVAKRLEVYHEQTEPLIEYYRGSGRLRTVIGQEEVADTTALVFKALGIS